MKTYNNLASQFDKSLFAGGFSEERQNVSRGRCLGGESLNLGYFAELLMAFAVLVALGRRDIEVIQIAIHDESPASDDFWIAMQDLHRLLNLERSDDRTH